MRLLGVDFTSAPRRQKPIVVAWAWIENQDVVLERFSHHPDWASFDSLLQIPGPWVGGFDFPFGLPRELVCDLGWPQSWPALVSMCAQRGRDHFRAALEAYRQSRAPGQKFAHRATDHVAGSSSPMKLINPPVGLMFFEGAPRLLRAGVCVPVLCPSDDTRIALEAYPGRTARAITRGSYKNDSRALQTAERAAQRGRIIEALTSKNTPLDVVLQASPALIDEMHQDAQGDTLDAALCALQAGQAWLKREQGFGLPPHTDPIEGWTIGD